MYTAVTPIQPHIDNRISHQPHLYSRGDTIQLDDLDLKGGGGGHLEETSSSFVPSL